ncbi:hypothetical protein [Coleofasciculus sp. E2-BRE-01]|uniref:hypothetical protein n=1 Tax=Coleofasciculus sp. E2-BRE-01 TaxID=3069524 RepID=UPI0032F61BC9
MKTVGIVHPACLLYLHRLRECQAPRRNKRQNPCKITPDVRFKSHNVWGNLIRYGWVARWLIPKSGDRTDKTLTSFSDYAFTEG